MNHPYMPETGIAIRLAPLAEPRGTKKEREPRIAREENKHSG